MEKKRFVVVGLGNFGHTIAAKLYEQGHEVVAVDTDEAAVDRIAAYVSTAAVADGRQIETLKRLGADKADVAVVSTGDDITASILATMSLKDLKVEDIFVKVISINHARVMDKIGVTESIFPERESALRLAARIASKGILNYIRMGTTLSIQELAVPTRWIGRSLRELELPRRYRISVIALHDMLRDEMIPIPDPDAPLKDSDTILIAGKDEDLAQVERESDDDVLPEGRR